MLVSQSASPQTVSPGQRVRLTSTTDSILTGVVDSVRGNQIWLHSTPPHSPPVQLDYVRILELSQGGKAALGDGLAYGALGGAIVGGALWLAFINGDPYEEMKGMWAAVFVGSGAVGGAVAGMGLSLALARERWKIVPRDQWAARWLLGLRFFPR